MLTSPVSQSLRPVHGLVGYCSKCRQEHHLPVGKAREHCLELMEILEKERRLDIFNGEPGDPLFTTESLFGEARGKMLGVLEGWNREGNSVILYAFSGQFNSCWNIPGWAPPLFDVRDWHQANFDCERRIKKMTAHLERGGHNPHRAILKGRRKKMSQQLMTRLHALYTIGDFHGERSPLATFFPGSRGIPTGTGDCCAPKLLNFAQMRGIVPSSIAEFYWGRENKSSTRQHGRFYPACEDKCGPLLGYQLCGLAELQSDNEGRR